MHPHFPDIVKAALREGMRVDLLSNATWRAAYNDLFARVVPNRLLFLLNIDHPDNYASRLWGRIEHNLTALTGRKGVTLSFNIFEKRPNYQYVLDLAARYDIRAIRLSFSLPVLGTRNAHLAIEEYQAMAPFVVDFVRRAEARNVGVQLDNAIPLCIFSYEQAGELMLKGVLDLGRNSRCEPIVDIGPDLKVWCCFCLSTLYNRHLDEFQTLQEVQDFYRQVLSLYQGRIYPMDECHECRYRELWACQGGCITYSIGKRGEVQPDRGLLEEKVEGWGQKFAFRLSEDVVISRYEIPTESYVLSHTRSGLDLEVGASLKTLWPLLNGQHTMQQVMDGFLGSDNGGQGNSPTDHFEWTVSQEGLNDLLIGLLHQGFLVRQPAADA